MCVVRTFLALEVLTFSFPCPLELAPAMLQDEVTAEEEEEEEEAGQGRGIFTLLPT